MAIRTKVRILLTAADIVVVGFGVWNLARWV
jgi:hypothetical protein